MAIWQKLVQIVEDGVGALGAVFEWAGNLLVGDAETRRQVAFSAAMIALSAKMAKADGVVTHNEVATFQRLFVMQPGEERHVARLFDLAKQDIAGFEYYARRVAAFYGEDRQGLEDVLDGLFVIATADGAVHRDELSYLDRVGEILGIDGNDFERIAARHVVPEEGDPYVVLGADRSMALADIRRIYRALVAENHPDRLMARGVPPEFLKIATERLAAINGAMDRIGRERSVPKFARGSS
jgi:DnaJ like chaperone protein